MNRKSRKESKNVRKVRNLFGKLKNFFMIVLLMINVFSFFYVAIFMSAVGEKGKQVVTYIIVTALCYLAYKGLCKVERIVVKKLYRREKEIKFRKEYSLTK